MNFINYGDYVLLFSTWPVLIVVIMCACKLLRSELCYQEEEEEESLELGRISQKTQNTEDIADV